MVENSSRHVGKRGPRKIKYIKDIERLYKNLMGSSEHIESILEAPFVRYTYLHLYIHIDRMLPSPVYKKGIALKIRNMDHPIGMRFIQARHYTLLHQEIYWVNLNVSVCA